MSEFNISPRDIPCGFEREFGYCEMTATQDTSNVQWPLKIMRISSIAPYFHKTDLVVASDCSAFSCSGFREKYTVGHTVIIGCPDVYGMEFYVKLGEIISLNEIKSVTLVRMSAPCCTRMTDTTILAIRNSGKEIPLRITTLFTEGEEVV